MRVLICGDREWNDYKVTLALVKSLKELHGDNLVIIEGECRGADRMARQAAEELDIKVLKFPAEWSQFGGAAGPIRNEQMIREGKPQLGFACHNNLAHSKGTKDMVKRLKAHKIKCLHVYSQMPNGPEEL